MPPASASAVNSNYSALAAAKAEREERLSGSLRAFILRERQRKKEEFEAKVEEERLRKEREARERQNDMTLEETRGQICKLDQKLTELRNEKQQLFLQLKKVLNEDENRKKQMKDNEMFAIQAMQAQQANIAPPPQVFLPPVRLQHHTMSILTKPLGGQPLKRGRSPSPPPGFYKSTGYPLQKHDDGRRNADYARVLWNKPPTQYQNPGTLFYQTSSNAASGTSDTRGPAIIYPTYNLPLRPGYHIELQPAASMVPVSKSDSQSPKAPQVYHINLDQPPISQASIAGVTAAGLLVQKPQVTMEKIAERFQVEVKLDGPPHQLSEAVVYTPLAMPLHPNVLQISTNSTQTPKNAASITQGYVAPGREPQLARQPQITVLPGQPGQPQPQQLHYARRLY